MKYLALVLAFVLLSGCDYRLLSPEASASLEETNSAIWRGLSKNSPYGSDNEIWCQTHPDYAGGYQTICHTQ